VRRINEVPKIARLKRDAHKGDRGRVLIVAGSLTMSGAARLAGWGALRGGAGLVTIATPDVVQPIVAAETPCAMTLPLPSRKGALIASGAAAARAVETDAVAIGPGITTSAKPFLRRFLEGIDKPIVLDADALNILARHPDILDGAAAAVLTPHPGEAERLLGRTIDGERIAAASELADRFGAVVVLKGAGTVVCDGDRYYVNRSGNPGMATGGTGDVLAGLLAARLAAGTDPFPAAVQAVHIHGLAGDLAAAAVGENAMIATDLIANLPAAVATLIRPDRKPSGPPASGRRGRR
jgi:NAD(P)H-hydrate epimerase